tara:strand:+ start:90 stop:704 length:615 start_codon:yes stop_codon:yes gene_type:complete
MKSNIKFYMTPASPWSYLSMDRIEEISKSFKISVDLIPVDVFKLFEMQEIKMVSKRPLAIQKNRLRELERWRDYLQVKLNITPKFFPVDPTKACKLIIASQLCNPQEKEKTFFLTKKLSEAVWVDDLNINDEDLIFDIAKKTEDIVKLKNYYFSDETDIILKSHTNDAFKQDIFGVPTFLYNNEIFWGQDRLFFLEKLIKKLNV